jgi:type II secretory pathway pseudopilin PulG
MTRPRRILTEKRHIIAPLGVGIIAVILLYVLVVFPLGRQVTNAEADARAAHDALNDARLEYQSAKATVNGKQEADAALEKFYKDVLPRDESAARKLTYARLAELARDANVRLQHGNNAVEHIKGSQLSELTTTYTLAGDYRDVRRFIYSLETAPEFVILDNVALASAIDQENRGLAMTLEISTYFRTGDAAE